MTKTADILKIHTLPPPHKVVKNGEFFLLLSFNGKTMVDNIKPWSQWKFYSSFRLFSNLNLLLYSRATYVIFIFQCKEMQQSLIHVPQNRVPSFSENKRSGFPKKVSTK